jgi:sirohydrochlorin ferrochelatase
MLGLLLVDHGSRREDSNQQLEDMAERVRRLRPGDAVVASHMELAAPSIGEGYAQLVGAGASKIHVLPYFLGHGRHISEDIPRLVATAAATFPHISYTIAPALGPHDALAQLLLHRAGLA